jgi:ketosteroid isomerase-like protein
MMTPGQAVGLVYRYAEAGTTGNLDALDDIFAADFVNHHPTGPEQGLEALKNFVGRVRKSLPDLTVTVETAFSNTTFPDGPRVGALVTLRGHSRERNQNVEFREFWIFRVSEGKLAERWYVVEQAIST